MKESNLYEQNTGAVLSFFQKEYKNIEAEYYRPLISAEFGGDFLLDSVVSYKTKDIIEFVTLGFSDVAEKEIENGEYSGYGFELAVKLNIKDMNGDNISKECNNICSIFNGLAGYIFESGKVFKENQYIYTGQTQGIDAECKSALTGFVITAHKAGTVDTVNGKVKILQLTGMTDNELKAVIDKKIEVYKLLDMIKTDITDYSRQSVI